MAKRDAPKTASSGSVSHDTIVRMTLVEGIRALRSGAITSAEYCATALEQASRFQSHNIFTQLSPVYVSGAAEDVDARRRGGARVGAFEGVPYALKDSIDMVEYYTIAGHPALRYFEPSMDAETVTTCRQEDAVCIGKTQLPPLSLWWTTENPMTGDTGNPFDAAYKTGGSSGGSGAAVAARIVPFAMGEDTAGSVRVPAALNGVLGFRPTTGRWPTAGTVPIAFSDTLGPIARSVADLKLLDSLLAVDRVASEPSTVDVKLLRIGYQREGFFDDLHPWVEENAERTLSALSAAGATLVELRGLPSADIFNVVVGIQLSDFPGALARYFERHRVWDRSAFGLMHSLDADAIKQTYLRPMQSAATGEAYFALVEELMVMRRVYHELMTDNRVDVLVYPTTKVPNTPNDGSAVVVSTGPAGETVSQGMIGANMEFAPGMKTPSIAMFSGMDSAGLPLSVTFDGYTGQDRRLLDIAEVLEGVLPPLSEPDSI